MKSKMIWLLAACLFGSGCAGRQANPVLVSLPSDYGMGCDSLNMEISSLANQVQLKSGTASNVGTKNLLLGIGGVIVWPLWFGMDLKKADKTELRALVSRHRHLSDIRNANCK